MWKRVLLAIGATLTIAALFEGTYTLVSGEPSVLTRRWLHPRLDAGFVRMGMLDEERMAAAALTEGPFDEDVDPLVGGRLKAGLDRLLLQATTRTDRWGQRVRAGGRPEPGAQRIVVLGDSVAFGMGVSDGQALGHRLETWLAGAIEQDDPPPAVWTVASPGWNTASQTRFLLNHLERLDPDLVVLMPVENDLDDRYFVNGFGHREGFVAEPGLPGMGVRDHVKLFMESYDRRAPLSIKKAHLAAGGRDVIAPALLAGHGPESRRRWGAMFGNLSELRERLTARGARLCIAHVSKDTFAKAYGVRLREAGLDIKRTILVEEQDADDTLGYDVHGNPRFVDLCARIMAGWLIQERWIENATRPLPPHEEAERRRGTALPAAAASAWLDELLALQLRFAGPTVNLRDATGFHQIYSGIASDGGLGRYALAALRQRDPAKTLRVHVLRLPATDGVYPLSIALHANRTPIGVIEVPAPKAGEELLTFQDVPLPEAFRDQAWIDVGLEASNWIVLEEDGVSRTIACRVALELR